MLLAALWLACGLGPAWAAGAPSELSEFGDNPGDLRMFRYVPQTLPDGAALVVALHGCTQQAAEFGANAGWIGLAERGRFALLLPQQSARNNGQRCFNWFRPQDTSRDQGEALSIRRMIERMQRDYRIDPARIYITGLSAGGAMTAVMLASYPEVFAGGAIVAGVPYRCASGLYGALWCQYWGSDRSPGDWAERVRRAGRGRVSVERWPRVSIWQGDRDGQVTPGNAEELVEQWTAVHGIDARPDREEIVQGHRRRLYQDAAGQERVESYLVKGLKHGQPIDPGAGETACGVAADYILDADICAGYYIARFWGLL